MTIINVFSLKNNLSTYVDAVIEHDEHITITTNKGNAVIISENEYNSLKETLYLHSQEKLVKKIKQGEKEDISKMSSNW